MRLLSSCFVFFPLTILKLVIAAPAVTPPPPNTLHPLVTPLLNSTHQPSFNCNDPSHGLDSSCWQTLNLTGFVSDWWTANGTGCGDIGFGQCFLNAMGLAMMACSEVNVNTCPAPSPTNLSAQEFYIAYAIYAINQFFTSYWTALNNAASLASDHIAAIVGLVDPPLQQHVSLGQLLLGISAGFSFIQLEQRVIERAIQSCPTVGRCLYPPNSADSRFMQLGQLSEQLADLVDGYQYNLTAAVAAITSSSEYLVTFAETGAFSGALETLQVESDHILQGLVTFVIAQALKANSMVITRAIGANPLELQQASDNNSQPLAYDLDCTSYDENGMCGTWWYDPSVNTAYSIDNLNHMNRDYGSMMNTFFGNWTTPELLIAGAARCHDNITIDGPPPLFNVTSNSIAATSKSKRADAPGTVLSIDANGIETNCLSDVTVCTYDQDQTCMDSTCEFTDCPVQNGFVANGCTGNADGSMIDVNVPYGYLGPWLWDSDASTMVCRS